MAAVYGKVEEFDSKKEEWPQYVEQLSNFFTANEIMDGDKKRAILVVVKFRSNFLSNSLHSQVKQIDSTSALDQFFPHWLVFEGKLVFCRGRDP